MAISSDPTEGVQAGTEPIDAELVHETRKAIKRMRALARLLRYELGEHEFQRVNDSLRLAGRRLAGPRDAEVRLVTLDKLIAHHPKALAREGLGRLREQLERERAHTLEPAPSQEVLEDIAGMRRNLARWNLVEHDFAALVPGLERVYREGRRRFARVRRHHGSEPEVVHDWRKRVKSLYYALDMLGGATGAKQARSARRSADRLGDLLGEEHDLWMLCVHVEHHTDAFAGDASAREVLLELADRRRRRLRKRALALGGRLYRRKPGAFTRRIGRALNRSQSP
jgi:CHAD domain-containing protein